MRSDHAVPVAGVGPLDRPIPVLVGIHPAIQHLSGQLRIQYGEEGPDGPERIPESVAGPKLAVVYASVVRTIILRDAIDLFPHGLRKREPAVEAGIEDRFFLFSAALDCNFV